MLADIAHMADLVAVGLFPNPILYADIITFTIHKTLYEPRRRVILAKKELEQKVDKAIFSGNQNGSNPALIATKLLRDWEKRVFTNCENDWFSFTNYKNGKRKK